MYVIYYTFDTKKIDKMNNTLDVSVGEAKSINIISKKDEVFINIQVENVFEGDDLTLYNEFINNFTVIFGVVLNVPIRNFRNCGHRLPTRDGEPNHTVKVTTAHIQSPATPTLPTDLQLNNILKIQKKLSSPLERHLRMFSFANSQPDAISRFSFLYNLLLQIAGDKQSLVDQLILIADPKCKKTPSPLKRIEFETIFTKLRNELAHKRDKTEYAKTRKGIEEIIEHFSNIIRTLLITRIK